MDGIVGPKAETLIASLLVQPETARFEAKRLSGKMVGKTLETIRAFANTAGGTLARMAPPKQHHLYPWSWIMGRENEEKYIKTNRIYVFLLSWAGFRPSGAQPIRTPPLCSAGVAGCHEPAPSGTRH